MSGERPVIRPGRLVYFTRRTSRAGFWWIVASLVAALAAAIAIDLLMIASGRYPATIFVGVMVLGILPASACRRLHDRGRSGLWLLPPLFGPVIFAAVSAIVALSKAPGDVAADRVLGPVASLALSSALLFSLCAAVWLLIELLRRGDEDANRFGPPPGMGDETPEAS